MTSIIEPTTPPNHSLSSNNNSTNINNPLHFHSHQQPLHQPKTPATSTTASSNSSSSTANTSYMHNRSLSSNGSFAKFGTHPNVGKSVLWDSSNKLNHNLNLPNFNIDNEVISTPLIIPSSNRGSVSSTTSTPSSQVSSFQKLSLDTTNYNSTTTNNNHTNNSNTNNNDKNIVKTTGASIANNGGGNYKLDTSTDNKENLLRKSYNGTDAVVGVGSENVVNVIGDVISNSSASTPPSSINYALNPVPSIIVPPKIDKEYLVSINKLPLTQLKSEILKLAKDQYGCRFLQKKIDENLVSSYQVRASNFEVIFDQIYPCMCELIVDPFGNYLVQKMIPYCSEDNLSLMLEILQYNLCQISVNQHGTRALQKIIDSLNNTSQLSLLIKGLKPYIIDLIRDLNGNHVIQKILNKYKPPDCQFIYDSIIEDLYTVATHKHGCCVLQKCLNHVTSQQLDQFSKAILKFDNFKMLINDQFGNYVLQYLISINSIDVSYGMFQNFLQVGITNLCNSKFSSNVVEKFLKNCYNNEPMDIAFARLKVELIYNILANDLNVLVNDPYGNYVIQTLLDILIHPQINYLNVPKISALVPRRDQIDPGNEQSLQVAIIKYWFQNCKIASSFGKRIQSKINTILNNNGATSSSTSINKVSKKSSQMNANGEFVINEVQYQVRPQNYQPLGPHHETSSEFPYQLEQHPQQQYFRNSLTPMANQNGSASSIDYIHPLDSGSQRRNFSMPSNFYSTKSINNNNNSNNNLPAGANEFSHMYTPTANVNSMNPGSSVLSMHPNNTGNGMNPPPSNYLLGGDSQSNMRKYTPEDMGNSAINPYAAPYIPPMNNGGMYYQQPQPVQMAPPFYPAVSGQSHQHSPSVGTLNQSKPYHQQHQMAGHYITRSKDTTPPLMQVPNYQNGLPGPQAMQFTPNGVQGQQPNSVTPMSNRGVHHSHNVSWSSSSSNQGGTAYGTPSW
ncbi:MPT5 [Candida margitis]|uniref:MPT5 n=1 Tax=Candida margitis TaxID=1775924 RepID=UPI002226F069|nr:MPT5 [Candida margitis]KAI5969627.1 MPT5 [Candida margitis]